jgi:O-succinylbenzoic acid--CoA ligase
MLVEGWLGRAAATHPRRTALQTPDGSWSYAELHAAAIAGAGELHARGAGEGTRVAIALPAGLELARALHACLLLGAVAVPLDLRLAASERAAILARCTVVVEEPLAGGAAAAEHGVARCRHDLDRVAAVIHTSGTTAAPRPVELTYGNFLWSAIGSAVALGVAEQERWLCTLPVSHVGGLSILIRSAIYGTGAVVHERFETDRALHALEHDRITLVSLVATTLGRLLDGGLQGTPTLRCALTGGGPVPAALLRRAHAAGVPVSLTYGLTESCSQATTTPVAEIAAARAKAGPPLFCTRLRLAEDGEILLRGPTVAPAAPGPDGWLHTGDVGRLDGDGRLLVSGRKADTIVSGGENVSPVEVEAVLEAHPDVREAAVLGRPDPTWGERVTAIVVARPGREPASGALREHCARALAPFKVPKQIELADGPLPRTPSGKLLRRSLR